MKFNILEYSNMLIEKNIAMIYSGPLWAEGIDGIAEMLQRRLDMEDMPLSASQAVFSIFVEQMNNMLMYSPEDEANGIIESSRNVFVLGRVEKTYFLQTGNVMKSSNVKLLKDRIDYLNTLDKREKHQFFKEQRRIENNNPESKGGGIGLIEIARRASSKIEYDFTSLVDETTYFSMFVSI